MRGAPCRLQVRLAADAASVPAARRFVADDLTAWGEGGLVDAAELVARATAHRTAVRIAIPRRGGRAEARSGRPMIIIGNTFHTRW